MQSIVRIIAVTSIIIFCVSGCGKNSRTGEDIELLPAQDARSAADCILTTVDGKTISLSDYRGSVIILNFWATWCGPCRQEIQEFVKIMNDCKEKPFTIIGISIDDQSRIKNENMLKFMQNYNINYPIAFASEQCLRAYGPVRAIPTTYIIDRNGKARMKIVGAKSEKFFRGVVDKLLAEHPI